MASCTEDQATQETAKMEGIILNTTPTVTYDSTIWNSANPYDSIGYWHNMGEDYIVAHKNQISKTDGQAFINSMASLSAEFANSLGEGSVTGGEISSTTSSLNSMFASQSAGFEQVINNNFSENVAPYLISICSALTNPESNMNTSATISNIKAVEATIISDVSLTTKEKSLLLRSASIARFSTVYWADKMTNSNSDWSNWASVCDLDNETEALPLISTGVAVGVGAVVDVVEYAYADDQGHKWYESLGYAINGSGLAAFTVLSAGAGDVIGALAGAIGSALNWIGI